MARGQGRTLDTHYHADTGDLVWPGGLDSDCHEGVGIPVDCAREGCTAPLSAPIHGPAEDCPMRVSLDGLEPTCSRAADHHPFGDAGR